MAAWRFSFWYWNWGVPVIKITLYINTFKVDTSWNVLRIRRSQAWPQWLKGQGWFYCVTHTKPPTSIGQRGWKECLKWLYWTTRGMGVEIAGCQQKRNKKNTSLSHVVVLYWVVFFLLFSLIQCCLPKYFLEGHFVNPPTNLSMGQTLTHTSYLSFHLHRHSVRLKWFTPKTRYLWQNWICVKRA